MPLCLLGDVSEDRPQSTRHAYHALVPSHLVQCQIKSHGQVQRQCSRGHTGVSHILPYLLSLLNTPSSRIQTRLPYLDLFNNMSSQMPNALV